VKENSPIHEQMKILFGEQCASPIWAASRFGSTLDADQRQTTLQIQAMRVVQSLEPYSPGAPVGTTLQTRELDERREQSGESTA
jgi:hypothetical protein